MARNGSGTYNLLTNSWNPATNGVSATAVDWQNLINDVAAALTQSLSADGQTPITGNLNAGNNKITGLAAGSATGDSLRWEQLFSQGQPANLASAATTDIGAQNTVLLNITGTTTITSFGTNYNGPRYVRFDGVLTLTHNATTLILPGGANITTAAGDSAIVVPNGTLANGWRVVGYQRADGGINATSLNGTQFAGFRNKIINGKMDISQRGTSFGTASLDGSYTLDRWVVGNLSAATFTVSQQLGVGNLQNCARVVVGTPDASIAAGDQAIFQQSIEGFNAFDLIGTTFTISFWVRSSVTGTYCIALRNSAFDRSYIATYTVNAVDTWEYKTVTVANGLPASGGTWNFTNGAGLRVAWTLACGSTFQTTAGAWQTGNFVGTSAQANFLATGSNTFQLTGVQLEVGPVATPFEHRPYGAELALCQLYGRPVFSGSSGRAGSATVLDLSVVLSSDMRVAPTLVFGGFSGANTTVAQFGVGNVTVTGISASVTTPRSVYAAFNTTGATTGSALAVTAGDLAFASAEL